jgi:hypothetical protein
VGIPAGSTSGTFTATGITIGQTTITATFAQVSLTATLTVTRISKDKEKDFKEKEIGKEAVKDKEFTKEAVKDFDVPIFERAGGILRNVGDPDRPSPTSRAGSDDPGGRPVTVHAFIRPDERPPVGQAILNQADHEEQG